MDIMASGDRVRITAGVHCGQEGTVVLALRSGLDINLDVGVTTYQFNDDVDKLVTV